MFRSRGPCWLFGLAVVVLVALETLGAPAAYADFAAPILLTGWNGDVVTDADPATRFAMRFDSFAAAWFEAGAGGHPDGLPSGKDFVSAALNTVTGGHSTFHLLPANVSNVLRLGDTSPMTASLSLVTPQRYSSLAILAASGSSFGLNVGTLTIHFADGTTASPLMYNAFDWSELTPGVEPFVALGGLARNMDIGPDGTGFTYAHLHDYAIYETDLDLAALGLDGKAISSITFDKAGGAFISGVFAVSGTAVPEPGAIVLTIVGLLGLLLLDWRRPTPLML